MSWTTLGLIFLFSWLLPFWVAIFIIAFDIYWFLKTIYLSLHMRSAFKKMRHNLTINWLEALERMKWRDIYHLVLLPMYKESTEVVRETFLSLSKANYPLGKLIVVLSVEEAGGEEALNTAKEIEKEFGDKFFKFLITVHPAGMAGEMAGKGSNDTWAIKEAKNKIIDELKISYENIIVSVFDVDTVIHPEFFGRLTHSYLTAEKPLRSSFQPIPLFTNNIWHAPAFARIFAFSTSFWQMIQQSRPERLITFSSQSIGFKPLVDIGFWQTNVVSEDSRIFWQCLLHFNGDWQTVPLFFPVYMDANVADSFFQTMKNQYKQIRRWAYGVENNAYGTRDRSGLRHYLIAGARHIIAAARRNVSEPGDEDFFCFLPGPDNRGINILNRPHRPAGRIYVKHHGFHLFFLGQGFYFPGDLEAAAFPYP